MAKILIVDDAKIMRVNMKKMLFQLGHEIVGEAENGYEAIEMYKKFQDKIDLVTMDITMPMKNGIEDGITAVEEIMEINPTAKIVMVTSHGEQAKVIKAIQAGALNYLLKPIRMEKLVDALEKLDMAI